MPGPGGFTARGLARALDVTHALSLCDVAYWRSLSVSLRSLAADPSRDRRQTQAQQSAFPSGFILSRGDRMPSAINLKPVGNLGRRYCDPYERGAP